MYIQTVSNSITNPFTPTINRAAYKLVKHALREKGRKFRPSEIEYFIVWTRDPDTKEKTFLRMMIRLNGNNSFFKITDDDMSYQGLSHSEVLKFLQNMNAKKIIPNSIHSL